MLSRGHVEFFPCVFRSSGCRVITWWSLRWWCIGMFRWLASWRRIFFFSGRNFRPTQSDHCMTSGSINGLGRLGIMRGWSKQWRHIDRKTHDKIVFSRASRTLQWWLDWKDIRRENQDFRDKRHGSTFLSKIWKMLNNAYRREWVAGNFGLQHVLCNRRGMRLVHFHFIIFLTKSLGEVSC